MFRKEFAILGFIIACFLFGSMAFPGGLVSSTAHGCAECAGMPSWGEAITASLALLVAVIVLMVVTILFHAIHITETAKDAIKRTIEILLGKSGG